MGDLFCCRPTTTSSTQECLKPEQAAVTAATEPDSSSRSKQLHTATVKTEKTEVNACNINELISEIKSEQVTPPEQANTPSPNPPPPDAGTATKQEDEDVL